LDNRVKQARHDQLQRRAAEFPLLNWLKNSKEKDQKDK